MVSRLRDLARTLRIQDQADIVSSAAKQFFRVIERLALPLLLLATLALVATAVSRALAWDSMVRLITDPRYRVQAETQIFTTLGQILGGGFILTGLYFTGKSYILARRGQFGERLGAAVEGLGGDSLERRVGSILSLGAMAGGEKDSASAIARVLCSFIRATTTTDEYRSKYSDCSPRADVQAAISVLARARRRTIWWQWISIDLRGSVLSHADFEAGDFRRTLFQDCVLTNTSFFRCRLSRANFSRAHLEDSDFNQADLRRASLFMAHSPSTTFRRSNLVRANLTRAELQKCGFDGARIIRCTFGQAKLDESTFEGAHIRGGEFHKVDPKILGVIGAKH
jgi:Pentapeptide repeats (9 copies)/Pentapeptide repeats (8 copies)